MKNENGEKKHPFFPFVQGGEPHVCAGRNATDNWLKQCWKLDAQSNEWTHAGRCEINLIFHFEP